MEVKQKKEIEMTKADSEMSSIHGVNILDVSLDNISMHPDINRLLVSINLPGKTVCGVESKWRVIYFSP